MSAIVLVALAAFLIGMARTHAREEEQREERQRDELGPVMEYLNENREFIDRAGRVDGELKQARYRRDYHKEQAGNARLTPEQREEHRKKHEHWLAEVERLKREDDELTRRLMEDLRQRLPIDD